MYKFKLVIADDEAFIRTGLEKLLVQTFPNVTVTGTYTNGKDVLDHLAREEIDILVTDIRMPQVSGLDVAQYVHEKGLVTRILVITGFQDFEYAQRALECQVDHLLLKPIDFEKLLDCVEQSMKDIEQKAQTVYEEARRTLMLHDLKRRDLAMLVSGELTAVPESRRSDLPGEGDRYTGWCALIRFSLQTTPDSVRDGREFWRDCGEFQDDAIDVYCVAGSPRGALFLLLSGAQDAESLRERTERYARDVSRYLEQICGAPASFTVNLYENITAIYNGSGGELSERYIECVLHKDVAGRRDLIRTAEKACNARQLTDMILQCAQRLSALYGRDFTPLLRTLETGVRKEEVLETLRQLDAAVEEGVAKPDSVVTSILAYIHKNYADDITLDSVADRFNFSRSHLSRMFKNETGERFVDFLGNVRLQHAKELLLTGKYSVKQIAEKVGYPNPRYFSTVFKEKTGMTPREYVLETVRHEEESGTPPNAP